MSIPAPKLFNPLRECTLYADSVYQRVIKLWGKLEAVLDQLIADERFASDKSQAQMIKALTTKEPHNITTFAPLIRKMADMIDDLVDTSKEELQNEVLNIVIDHKALLREVSRVAKKFFAYIAFNLSGTILLHGRDYSVSLDLFPKWE